MRIFTHIGNTWLMLQRLINVKQTILTPGPQLSTMAAAASLPSSWHSGPDDSFHGKITADGPFQPEKDRYHLYIGYFCPFAHRANAVAHLKQLEKYAGIETSYMRPYPKGDDKGWPGWQFNHESRTPLDPDATVDKLYGSKFLHEIYFKADKDYKGRYSVPVLWDKKLNTIVNNESPELLRDLQTAFDVLLPKELAEITLYPENLREQIDVLGKQLQEDLNIRVYKAGNAQDQEGYEKNVIPVFGMINKLEKLAAKNGGPYILGKQMTEVDVRTYATLIRLDVAYAEHFKCNLGLVRDSYPVLHNWLKNLYWNHEEFHNTTHFRHIKENYTKAHPDINPRNITPIGPYPNIESGYEADWSKLTPGSIDYPEVLEYEKTLG